MALSTQASISSYINKIFEDARFVARDTNLMTQLVTLFTDDGYATREVPLWAQASAVSVSETQDYSNATLFDKSTLATFTPTEVMSQFVLTDRRMSTDPDTVQRAAIMELGMAIATKIDTDLTGLFSGFSNGKGTAGSALTIGHVAAALASVRYNHGMGEKNVVLNPYQWHRIWKELGNPSANQAFLGETANQALREYFSGSFLGATWYSTGNVEIDASDDAYGAAFVREALGFDVRDPMTLRPQRDESARLTELNMHTGYAAGELREAMGCYILSDASAPTS